jgi:glycosyltransferase involved in cell wall biosynthesis
MQDDKLSLLYVTPSVSRDIGGIFEVERNLALELDAKGVPVHVVSLVDEHTEADLPKWLPLLPSCNKVFGPKIVGFSFSFFKNLLNTGANVGHIHSIWSYTTFALYKWAVRKKAPYLVSPNGMLDDWAINNSKWKKDLALFLGVRKILNRAACIQVNTLHEYHSVRKFGLTNPVCKISNGVNLPTLSMHYSSPWEKIPAARNKKILLYLSRIHPKKGVHVLLEAWKDLKLENPAAMADWHLVIVGFQFNEDAYENKLLSYIKDQTLQDEVSVLPGQYGEDMDACYANCDTFILPSFSEGVPMAVLHAWSFAKPAIITGECNLPEGFEYGAAVKIDPELSSIKKGILEIVNSSGERTKHIGQQARKLVEDKFSWTSVAAQLLEVYEWVHAGGKTPSAMIRD